MFRSILNLTTNTNTNTNTTDKDNQPVLQTTQKKKEAQAAGCKVCEGFKSWTTTQKANTSTTTKTTKTSEGRREEPPEDCPADLGRLGRHSWTLLHTIGATYPEERPTEIEKKAAQDLIHSLSILFPCRHCAHDLKQYIKSNPPLLNDRFSFENWLCNAHNHVNLRTGKPIFDCSLISQRWRDGWNDGRCNPPQN